MELERYEKWEPVDGITTPAGHALIKDDEEGLSVTLIFSAIVNGLDIDLRIHFGFVAAYTVHEEFVHPWNTYDSEPLPKLEGKWKGSSFPLLIVKNSVWLGSFAEHQLTHFQGNTHYRFVTSDDTVDVLCNKVPEASWVKPQPRVTAHDRL
jgi:hypothetical protein